MFLFVCLFFGASLQPVWLDEVALTEPASNLYLYGEFTSSAWYHQPNNVFHVSTSPLYVFMLALWMKIVGFSILKVRLLNYLLMILSSVFLWLAVKRLKLLTSPCLRIILVVSFLMIGGINFSYISGRYDIICILLCLIIFFLFSINNVKKRLFLITLVGFFLPSSGLSSVVFSILLLSILLVFNYQLFWKEFISVVVGISYGLMFLYLLYSMNINLTNRLLSFTTVDSSRIAIIS
jgi:hypothetical protein